jgi:hypothetical protein
MRAATPPEMNAAAPPEMTTATPPEMTTATALGLRHRSQVRRHHQGGDAENP